MRSCWLQKRETGLTRRIRRGTRKKDSTVSVELRTRREAEQEVQEQGRKGRINESRARKSRYQCGPRGRRKEEVGHKVETTEDDFCVAMNPFEAEKFVCMRGPKPQGGLEAKTMLVHAKNTSMHEAAKVNEK